MKIHKKLLTKYGPKAVGFGLNVLNIVAPKRAAKKSLEIFCTPRNGRVKSYQRKFLSKFHQRKLYLGDDEIMTYHHEGAGPRILLCHGWESNTFRWRKLFKKLKTAHFDIISLDAPAHGQSGSDTFNALLYSQMINVVVDEYHPDIIVGHSVGGMAAIFYLHNNGPKSINKAIILASPDRLEDLTDNYFSMIGGGKKLRDNYNTYVREVFQQDISYFSAASFANSFQLPCLIIHDREDTINHYVEGERIHKAWKDSVLHSTNGYGHSLQAEEIYDKVVSFALEGAAVIKS